MTRNISASEVRLSSSDNIIAPVTAVQQNYSDVSFAQIPKPNLKRKRSSGSGFADSDRDQMPESLPSPSSHLDDVSPEQKRTKLGYHRTSIACGHCRHRKIRCLVSAGDESCTNCIRLKKECFFHPVEPSQAKTKRQPKGKTHSVPRRSLALPSNSPTTKKRYSDSSIHYSTNIGTSQASQILRTSSPEFYEEPRSISDSLMESYPLIDPSWETTQPPNYAFQPIDYPQQSYGMSYRHSISLPPVSPKTQVQGLSPSPHPEFNPHLTAPSPRITFTSDVNSQDWSKTITTSSYDTYSTHQALLSPQIPRSQTLPSVPPLDLKSMTSQAMSGADYTPLLTADELHIPLSAVSSLAIPALSVSESISPFSVSPFSDQQAWSGFTQHDNPLIHGKAFDENLTDLHWFASN